MDEVRSGSSYVSQNDLRLHFARGRCESGPSRVIWPSGRSESFGNLKANQIAVLNEERDTSHISQVAASQSEQRHLAAYVRCGGGLGNWLRRRFIS